MTEKSEAKREKERKKHSNKYTWVFLVHLTTKCQLQNAHGVE
jgi:hypothetical protein